MPITRFPGGTLVDLMRWRAACQPDHPLYTFLHDGSGETVELSFADVDRRARAIAATIRDTAAPGDRALLVYPDGLDFAAAFFGCLYAGVVAVPAYPPDPARLERTLPRLQAIVADAEPALVLTTQPIAALREQLGALAPDLLAPTWLASDAVSDARAGDYRPAALRADDLALLQYTSGSTSTPKGVMITHGNLIYNEEMIRVAFEHDEHSLVVGWLPVFHDMGLIGNLLQPAYMGVRVVLMSPLGFLRKPFRWLEAISDYRATTAGAPNFAYELCVRKISPEQRARLDLRSWTLAFNGSEPVSADTVERFSRAFAECGFRRETFYPCYGMAEATLFISGGRKAARPVVLHVDRAALERNRVEPATTGSEPRALVGCGGELLEERLAIVDPETARPCKAGEIGEIWVSGPHVARGYWRMPAETAESFGARLTGTPGPRWLRTGDLGFLDGDEIYVTGRCKDLIVIRGRNYYPQDIEQTLAVCDASLRPGSAAAFAIERDGEERLVVVQEVRAEVADDDLDEVLGRIRQAVTAEHQLQLHAAVLIEPGSIPKTSSGKIRRRACRDLFLAGGLAERRRFELGAPRAAAAR